MSEIGIDISKNHSKSVSDFDASSVAFAGTSLSSKQCWIPSRIPCNRTMESKAAVISLSALAQGSRLEVYRLLVQVGPDGMAASEIAERLGVPANTLSFHLKTLSHAGLVQSRQEGRFIFYSTNYDQMNELLSFLTENCCGDKSCVSLPEPARKRKTS